MKLVFLMAIESGENLQNKFFMLADYFEDIGDEIQNNEYGKDIEEICCMTICTRDNDETVNLTFEEIAQKVLNCKIVLNYDEVISISSDEKLIELFTKNFFDVLELIKGYKEINFDFDKFADDFRITSEKLSSGG